MFFVCFSASLRCVVDVLLVFLLDLSDLTYVTFFLAAS